MLNGLLDNAVWQRAPIYADFETVEPDFGNPTRERTQAQVAYDDSDLYFALNALDSEPGKVKASVTKWDNLVQDDWVGVGLDALNDRQTAYGFLVNAFGSQGAVMQDYKGVR